MATLKELLADEATAKEFLAQETPEAALAFLQGKGVEITLEEFSKMLAEAEKMQDGALSEGDLENVAGGFTEEHIALRWALRKGKPIPPEVILRLN